MNIYLALLVILSLVETLCAFSIFQLPQTRSHGSQLYINSGSTNDGELRSYVEKDAVGDRRQAMKKMIMGAIISSAVICSDSKPSNAACLAGDTSADCIGVYKLPLDDSVSSYIDTPEHLAKNAPDLRWVPMVEKPKSVSP